MKDMIEGLYRMVLVGAGGYLLHGWRGAVAAVLFAYVLTGLVSDHATIMVRLSRR